MNRRDFLRRAAIVAAGAVAADQLELLERLTHRKVWPGANFGTMTGVADDDYIVFANEPYVAHYTLSFQVIQARKPREEAFARWANEAIRRAHRDIVARYGAPV